jgi:hypothetical protein
LAKAAPFDIEGSSGIVSLSEYYVRKTVIVLILGGLIVGIILLTVLPRSLPFEQAGVWWDSDTNAILEFTAQGQVIVTQGPCSNMQRQQEQHQVVIQKAAFFFPATQVEQPYRSESLLTSLVHGKAEVWFSVEEGGPIPAGAYIYTEFAPIGICGLEG